MTDQFFAADDRLDNDYTSIQSRSSELQSILNKLTRRAERPSFMI